MNIITYYMDGSLEEYNTDSHFSSPSMFRSNATCATTCTLDVDNLENGLFVQFWQHDLNDPLMLEDEPGETWTRKSYQPRIARINYFGEDQVLDQTKLDHAMSVYSGSTLILHRINPDGSLVRWSRFTSLCALYIKNHAELSYVELVAKLYDIMHGDEFANPRLPKLDSESDDEWDQRIANAIGWSLDDVKLALEQRAAALMKDGEMDPADDDSDYDMFDDSEDFPT